MVSETKKIVYFVLLLFISVIVTCSKQTEKEQTQSNSIAKSDTQSKQLAIEINEIPQLEYEALVALFSHTGGSYWKNDSNWLQTNTPYSWYGVECKNGHVTRLNLANNGLSGRIPTEIGNLTHLENLELGFNTIRGEIPPEIGRLVHLKTLSLHDNRLKGELPVEIANLSNLGELYLYANQLDGNIPKELGSLTNLMYLDLSHNIFSGEIPPELGKLYKLWSLDLMSNQLGGFIPSELGNLISLQTLDIAGNPLIGEIPLNFLNLKYLNSFNYHSTHLCEPRDDSLKIWLAGIHNVSNMYVQCFKTIDEYNAFLGEENKKKPQYAILNKELIFIDHTYHCTFSKPYPNPFSDQSTIPDTIAIGAGSLVRVFQNKSNKMMTLIDGKRLASIRQFADSAFTIINDAQRDSILSNIFEPINILGAANTNNFVSYLATILPDGSLIDYSEPWDFQFYGSLIFKENQEVFVYHDSLNKTISTIVTVPPPEGTFESHGFILDNPPLKKEAIVSTKPLKLYAISVTPDYNELLKQEKNLTNGESYHDYKIIAKLDLDNDGVNELIFQEVGYESVRYSIYKFFDSMWQVVYRGG